MHKLTPNTSALSLSLPLSLPLSLSCRSEIHIATADGIIINRWHYVSDSSPQIDLEDSVHSGSPQSSHQKSRISPPQLFRFIAKVATTEAQ